MFFRIMTIMKVVISLMALQSRKRVLQFYPVRGVLERLVTTGTSLIAAFVLSLCVGAAVICVGGAWAPHASAAETSRLRDR